MLVERVTVSEHFIAVEYVPERRVRPRAKTRKSRCKSNLKSRRQREPHRQRFGEENMAIRDAALNCCDR